VLSEVGVRFAGSSRPLCAPLCAFLLSVLTSEWRGRLDVGWAGPPTPSPSVNGKGLSSSFLSPIEGSRSIKPEETDIRLFFSSDRASRAPGDGRSTIQTRSWCRRSRGPRGAKPHRPSRVSLRRRPPRRRRPSRRPRRSVGHCRRLPRCWGCDRTVCGSVIVVRGQTPRNRHWPFPLGCRLRSTESSPHVTMARRPSRLGDRPHGRGGGAPVAGRRTDRRRSASPGWQCLWRRRSPPLLPPPLILQRQRR